MWLPSKLVVLLLISFVHENCSAGSKRHRSHHHTRKTYYSTPNNSRFTVTSDIRLYQEEEVGAETSLAKRRILDDKRRSLCHRTRRQIGQYYSSYGPCPRWANSYAAHNCVQKCPNSCANFCKQSVTNNSIYEGAGRNWYGPKHGCNCNPKGSELETCDIKDGKCRCKQHYTGRACDTCKDGYWNSAVECASCDCNPQGSEGARCDDRTGQCVCKPGVAGIKCDRCLPNYYGFSALGCKKCDDCSGRPGHVCHQQTGRCVCPPYSHGPQCNKCVPNSWGYEPNLGCKECDCSRTGGTKGQCNLETGECPCRPEYTGEKCNRCRHGFYGYPNCKPCDCNVDGTDGRLGKCDGSCQCDERGWCPCKKNAHGRKCNACKEGYFGLQNENPDGCAECFCFGRSTNCTNTPYTWGQNRTVSTRVLTLGDISSKNDVIESDRISGDYDNFTISDMDMIPWMNSMRPLYWRLPQTIRGDRVLSYNGYLKFSVQSFPPANANDQYPLVKLIGNGLELHYSPRSPTNYYEIRLHEDGWKIVEPNAGRYAKPKRANKTAFMIALQNVTEILIKATDPITNTFGNLTLSEMVMDTALEIGGNPPPRALGVEMCRCPRPYTGLSCQNPNAGYYRFRDVHSDPINRTVGRAEPCRCNGRSDACNVETGRCLNCKNNTDGFYCEDCAVGYYGDPRDDGFCRPCPCPSADRNFAVGCKPGRRTFQCVCKEGHTGSRCEDCAEHYYRDPNYPERECTPCNCNPYSSTGRCDRSGQCTCKKGFTGRQCSQCEKSRHIVNGEDCIPCDQCTQILLDKLDDLSLWIHSNISMLLNATVDPPWGKLSNFSNKYIALKDHFDTYQDYNLKAKDLTNGEKAKSLERGIVNLKESYQKTHSGLATVTRDAVAAQKQTDDEMEKLNKIMNDLNATTSTLENFGKGRVSTKDALKEAEDHLRAIRARYDEVLNVDRKEVYERCGKLEETVRKMHNDDVPGKTLSAKSDLREIQSFLEATDDKLKDIEGVVTETVQRNENNENRIDELRNRIRDQDPRLKKLNEETDEANAVLKRTSEELEGTRDILSDVDDGELEEAIVDLDNRKEDLAKEIQQLKKFVDLGRKHARDLNLNVTHVERMLELSDKEVDAVKASGAYSNIVNNLKDATRTATEARDELRALLKAINSTDRDTLSQIASISLGVSTRLDKRMHALQNKLKDMEEKLSALDGRLKNIKDKNWDNGIRNSEHSKEIHTLRNEYKDATDLKKVIDDADRHSDDMKRVYMEAGDVELKMQYDLNKLYAKCKNLTSKGELYKMNEQVSKANSTVQKLLNEKLINFDAYKKFDRSSGNFLVANKTLSQRLDELKRKIQKSREIADGIRVSMSGADCQRSYQLKNLRPSLITNLTIRLQIKNSTGTDKQISLFYLGNENDHIKIDVHGLKVDFEVRIGGETLTKTLLAKVEDNIITFERVLNSLSLAVNDGEAKLSFKEKSSKILNVTSSSLIHVGGYKERTGLSEICLDDVIVNSMRVGLWDFTQIRDVTTKCLGCVRSQIKIPLGVAHSRFNGEGYSLIRPDDKANPNRFAVLFSLRTFDENALLFLAIYHNESLPYLAISLVDGHIQYEIHYPRARKVFGRTEARYNNGQLVQIEFVKEYKSAEATDTSIMVVEGSGEIRQSIKVESKDKIKFKRVNFYVGGVPPDYKIQCPNCTRELHTHRSLLGDIKSFMISNTPYELYETSNRQQQYGVEWLSTPLEFTTAWFEGGGYLVLGPRLSQPTFSLSFVLRTEQRNGMVMHIESIGELIVENGYLAAQTEGGKDTKTNIKVDDDKYHIIEFTKRPDMYVLKIDGKEHSSPSNVSKVAGDTILGGKIDDDRAKFNGEIRDIIMDDGLLRFDSDTVKQFHKVKIGRTKPQRETRDAVKLPTSKEMMKMRDVAENMKDMQSTEGCNKVSYNYTLEPNAAKFGDVPESYVTYYMKESFWKNEYMIEIEFRTFYRNGLLLFAQGDGKHYYLLELKDNLVLLHASGKRKKTVQVGRVVDDGDWHTVSVERRFDRKKKRKKVTILSVDGISSKPQKIPQSKVFGEVYVGDIAKSAQHKIRKQTITKIHPFRGCIKPLKVNRNPRSFDDHRHIGQCFPNVEKGSYFRGDSYAIYSRNFRVTSHLELNLEFRTTEQSGILLSASGPAGSPAASLELHDGAVVLSVDMGGGTVTNVTNSLSEYALCNNRWHNLTALISTELTVNVDGVSKSWVISDVGPKEEIEGTLYIGGIPDHAPEGTLKVRENFKGCIRNLRIDEEQVDWIRMEELSNVALNSCPVT